MKLSLVSIPVRDPISAFKFYTEVLGFKEKMFKPEMWLAIVVSPEDPEGTTLLLEPSHNAIYSSFQQGVYKAGMPVIIFGTGDVQKEYERLKGRGVKFKSEPKKDEWGISAIFDDTCGNYIQIHQAI